MDTSRPYHECYVHATDLDDAPAFKFRFFRPRGCNGKPHLLSNYLSIADGLLVSYVWIDMPFASDDTHDL
jgi:hypothetical protein